MTGRLRAVISLFRMISGLLWDAALPRRMISLPLLVVALPFMFAMPLLFAAGCTQPVQDAPTDARQATQTPTMSAARESSSSPEMPTAPEGLEAPAVLSHEPVYLTSETTASMNLPFSDAVRVGHLLFLSGQIGNIPGTTDLAPGGIQGEARQTMENIRTVLEANGSSMDRVIKATVMLADIAEWPAFNEVYVTYFPGHKPARSAFAGSGLAFGARCEVEVIATVGE